MLAQFPVKQAELGQTLSETNFSEIRSILVEKVRDGGVSEQDESAVRAVFAEVGLGEQAQSLQRVCRDPTARPASRRLAFALLLADQPAHVQEVLETLAPDHGQGAQDAPPGLTPEDAAALLDHWLTDVLVAIQAEPEQAALLWDVLVAVGPSQQVRLLEHLETCRRQAGTLAVPAYGEPLARGLPAPLRRLVLQAVIEEASSEGIAMLETLAAQETDAHRRRELQGALLRARTKRIDPKRPAEDIKGSAFVGSCDGQGAFILVGCWENPDGHYTVADLCIRAAVGIRDGFVTPRRSREEIQQVLSDMVQGTGITFVEVPLGVAAAVVDEAVHRTGAAGRSLPFDVIPAVSLFDRAFEVCPHTVLVDPFPGTEGPAPLRKEDLRELLQRPEYARTWFFDRSDLQGLELNPQAAAPDDPPWFSSAMERLDRCPIRQRVAFMARHMALWHFWKGQPQEAHLCAAAARQVEKDFAQSALVQVMLERTAALAREASAGELDKEEGPQPFPVAEAETGTPGGMGPQKGPGDSDPDLDQKQVRLKLQERFFGSVRQPVGRDLARLDFAEAAFILLEGAPQFSSGPRPVTLDLQLQVAFELGSVFVDFLLGGAESPIEQVVEGMTAALQKCCDLEQEQCHGVIAQVLPGLGDFVAGVCGRCQVACLAQPDASMAKAFLSGKHPVR